MIQYRKITGSSLHGFGEPAPVSEFGVGLTEAGAAWALPAAPVPSAAPGAFPFGARPDFFRSSDFGLILFGLGLLYFDLRLINRGTGS